MADAQTPVLTDEPVPIGYVRKMDLPVAKERGTLVFRTPQGDWNTPVYLDVPPAPTAEAAAWRSRHRGEPGMIGHYPWSFMEREPSPAMRGSFEVQPLYTHPAPSHMAVMQQALDALRLLDEAFCANDYGTREGRDKGRTALIATRAAIAALSATMEKP